MRRHGRLDPVAVIIILVGLVAAAHAHPAHSPGGSHTAHLAHQSRGATGQAPSAASPAAGASTAISFAKDQLGKPYGYGATGPDSYDCSSLVQAAWAKAGVSIPRTSEEQWAHLPHVSSPQPGDLVFYYGAPEPSGPPGHVTMFLGGGLMIEAYATGYPIRITAVRDGIWGYARPGGG